MQREYLPRGTANSPVLPDGGHSPTPGIFENSDRRWAARRKRLHSFTIFATGLSMIFEQQLRQTGVSPLGRYAMNYMIY
jgi:hypothetical protein